MGHLVAPIFGTGQDGDTTYSGVVNYQMSASFTGTAGSTTGVATDAGFSNFINYPVLIHQTRGTNAGQWERNFMIGYSPGTVTLAIPLTNTYTSGAQILRMLQYRTVTIPTGLTTAISSYDGSLGGVYTYCMQRLVLNGTLSGVGSGFRGGIGGVNTNVGAQGESITGGGGGSSNANSTGGGGGTNLGTNGSGATTTVGTTDLSTILMGGGGGGSNVVSGQTAVNGGGGGGIVMLWVRELDITGTINVNGAAGSGGYRASGAGAGGSVLIFAQRIIRLGTNAITALGGAAAGSSNGGGTGGGGSHATAGTAGTNSSGGAGGNGRIAIAKCRIDDAGQTLPNYYDRGYQTYCGIVGRG